MAQSQTALYNLALSSVSARKLISSPTENSREAEMCNLWYEPVRRIIFRAAHWQSIKRNKRLGLIKTRTTSADWVSTDPDPGYLYVYSAPNDMSMPRYLSTFERFESGTYYDTKVPAIFTDTEDAILTYTMDQTDISLWDHDLYMTIALGIAAHICIPLTGKLDRAKYNLELANNNILKAQANNANEMDQIFDTMPEWIERRGYEGGLNLTRYYAPFGGLLEMPGAPVV